MALKSVAMCLLSFILLLMINGHQVKARDIKLQEQEAEKRVNQPYLDGWLKNTPEANEKDSHDSNQIYLDGWLKDAQDRKEKITHNFNQAYLDGWLKDSQNKKEKTTHNSNQAYLDGWLKDTQDMKEKTTHSNLGYLDGWLKDIHDKRGKFSHNSNQAYLDGWLKDAQDTQNSNQVYIDGWLRDTQAMREKTTHSNQVYLDGWLKDIQDKKEKASHDSNQPYLDGWLKDTQNMREKTTHSNQVYLDGWLKDIQDTTHNSNQVYLDGWLKDTKDGKGKATPSSNQVYLDGWLKDSYITNHKKSGQDLAKSKVKSSPKVDHKEAFKLTCFALDDLYVGNVMTLQFPVREYAHFLPRKHADSIPFSKSQLPSLLQLFSLTEDSPQGEDMKDIIDQCEFKPTKGETKACPTSLESMLEFVRSVLGAEAKYNIHTTSYPTTSGARLQNYTIMQISKDIYAPKWVACHPRPYPYALYYCHYLDIGSKVFKVLLRGEYGDIMDALGICHLDTSDMNPNHVVFRLLGIKPGDAPFCHFFPVKHLLWVPLPSEATM